MAASQAAARTAPPPHGCEYCAGTTAQWAAPGRRDNRPRLGPRPQSQLRLRAGQQPAPSAPRARAVLTYEPAASRPPNSQRLLSALGLQTANRLVPSSPSGRGVPLPSSSTGLDPGPSARPSPFPLSHPSPVSCPALLLDPSGSLTPSSAPPSTPTLNVHCQAAD